MTNSMVENIVYWMNSFLTSTSVSPHNLSPANIVTGRAKPDFKHPQLPFGAYVMAYDGTSNNMEARALPCIALKPSNKWGGCYMMSILTGKRIHAYKWTELPISNEVIDKVHELATEENQPELIDKIPLFEWEIGVLISDEADEEE